MFKFFVIKIFTCDMKMTTEKKVQAKMRMYLNENVRHNQVLSLLNLFREQETFRVTYHHVNAIFVFLTSKYISFEVDKNIFFIFTSIFLTICKL